MGDVLLTAWRAGVIFVWHAVLTIPSLALVALHPRGGEIGHALFARFWGRVTLATSGVPWVARGVARLDPTRAYVFVANHASEFDFYALSAALPFQWRALMRPGLRAIPLYGWTAARTGHVFLSQSDPERRRDDLERALAQLARGHSLLVFPEGERSWDGTLRPFKRGAFLLAQRAGVPVVPITVTEVLRRPRRRVLGRGLAHRIEQLRVVVHEPFEVPPTVDWTRAADRAAGAIAGSLSIGAER